MVPSWGLPTLGLPWTLSWHVISVIWNLLRLVLWPTVRYILINILCVFEKNTYSVDNMWNAIESQLGRINWWCFLKCLTVIVNFSISAWYSHALFLLQVFISFYWIDPFIIWSDSLYHVIFFALRSTLVLI